MFAYFDKNGTLREIINDEAIRQGNMNADSLPAYVNAIYAYFEGQDGSNVASCWAVFAKPDGSLTNEEQYTETATEQIPYDRKRVLKYFKYFTDYEFHVVPMPNEILAESGTCAATIRLVMETGGEKSILALGKIPFVVEDEVVKADHLITQSQYNYLISLGGATYYVPHIDKATGSLYWTNNGGLENPEPVTFVDMIGEGNVKTPNIADGAVTPEKLDRAYLPLAGGEMQGALTTASPIIEKGHFEVTPEGDALFAGASTFTGSVQMNGEVTFAGEGAFNVYKQAYLIGGAYLYDIWSIGGGNIHFHAAIEDPSGFKAGNNSMSDDGITATAISSYVGPLPITALGVTYVIGGRMGIDGDLMPAGILTSVPYVADEIADAIDTASANYVKRVTPPSMGDYAYMTTMRGDTNEDGLVAISQGASPSALARYDDDGLLVVNTPKERGQATNKGYVDDAIASIKSGAYKEVEALPDTGEAGTIYLVPDGSGNKEQYIWQDGAWVSLGDTSFQADNYYTKAQADDLLNGKLSASAGAVKPANLDPNGDYSVGTVKLNEDWVYTSGGSRYHFRPDVGGEVATTDDIGVADNEVTTRKIADYAVTAQKIGDAAVTADKIMDANVNGDKIADNAVWNNHIQNGAVSKPKLDEALQSEIDGKVGYSEEADASSLIKAPAFLSLGDARFVKQSTVPKLRSYELSLAATALKGKFGLGSYVPQGTEYCLIYYGDDPSPMTLATISSGEGGNWVVKPSQTLASGTEVSCGELLYKITQGICKAGAFHVNIWDCVKPIGCRFPLELSGTGFSINNMRECSIKISFTQDPSNHGLVLFNSAANCDVYLDTSEFAFKDRLNNQTFALQGIASNKAFPKNARCLSDGSMARFVPIKTGVTLPILNYDSFVLTPQSGTNNFHWQNYCFVSGPEFYYEGDDGKQMEYRFHWQYNVDSMGGIDFTPVLYTAERSGTTETMAKARAMSVQAEPSEPIMPRIPEGAVGIFSVDEHGNTINAMTGRKVNA